MKRGGGWSRRNSVFTTWSGAGFLGSLPGDRLWGQKTNILRSSTEGQAMCWVVTDRASWRKFPVLWGRYIILPAQTGHESSGKPSAMEKEGPGKWVLATYLGPCEVVSTASHGSGEEEGLSSDRRGSWEHMVLTTSILRPFSSSQPLTSRRPGDGLASFDSSFKGLFW